MRFLPARLLACAKQPRRCYSAAASFLDAAHGLSSDASMLHASAAAFAKAEMAPFAADWDERSHFPEEALRKAAANGFATMWVSTGGGGLGLSRSDSLPVLEALATACPATAAFLSIHGLVASTLDKHAAPALSARLLPALHSMDKFASYCLTEPGSGSDAASLTTRAVREGDEYVITGQKAFTSGGGRSDVYLVMARTGPAPPAGGGGGSAGISAFVVEKGAAGLSFGAREKKLGWNASPTAAVFFDGVRVPMGNLVGREGDGFKIAMSALDGGRLSIAACSLGAASAALEVAVEHVKVRRQFGAPLAALQGVQNALAECAMALYTARAAVRGGALALDAGHPSARAHCALAKAVATEQCLTVCDRALQQLGGYGYLRSSPIERLFRDARVHTILEGTSEIMRVILAKAVLQ